MKRIIDAGAFLWRLITSLVVLTFASPFILTGFVIRFILMSVSTGMDLAVRLFGDKK